MENANQAPFFQQILDAIDARSSWNTKDTEIQKRRLGDRPRKRNQPYPNAPNFVDQIIDDVVSEKTDSEVSMIMNAPSLVVPVPIGKVPTEAVAQVQRLFDTYLRHVIQFRAKSEECIDTKNARGFAVSLATRREHERFGVIPDFEAMDPKDFIAPWNLKVNELADSDGGTYVLRFSPRELRAKERDGWRNIDKLIARLEETEEAGEKGVSQSAYDDETHNSARATATIVGITTSDVKENKVVVWCHMHYATKWDVQRSKNPEIVLGRKCMSYICPDEPDLLLYAKPWKRPDKPAVTRPMDQREQVVENIIALSQGRPPAATVEVEPMVPGKDKPWPVVQHRFENRSRYWYDSRGLGHLLMDNQLFSTAIRNAQAVHLDYSKHFMFQTDGTSDVNQTNFKIKPGSILPRGVIPATMPQPPGNFDFLMDRERRLASLRGGAGRSLMSGQMQESRKVEKTKAEIDSTDAKQSVVTSASVDRFNDPYRELFQMLWEDLKELRPSLPMIDNGEFVGMAEASLYDYDFLMLPAASARTMNPEMQYMKNRDLAQFALSFTQLGVPVDARFIATYTAANANPDFAKGAFPDPAKIQQPGQMPINMQLDQIRQMLQQTIQSGAALEQDVRATQKLALEHDDKLAEVDGVVGGVAEEFSRAGIPIKKGGRPQPVAA